jgi:subtilisin-like proprotein convertase family protein
MVTSDLLVHGSTASYVLLGPIQLDDVRDIDDVAAILIDPSLGTPVQRMGDIDGDGVGDLIFRSGDEVTVILGGIVMPRTLSASTVESSRVRLIDLPNDLSVDGVTIQALNWNGDTSPFTGLPQYDLLVLAAEGNDDAIVGYIVSGASITDNATVDFTTTGAFDRVFFNATDIAESYGLVTGVENSIDVPVQLTGARSWGPFLKVANLLIPQGAPFLTKGTTESSQTISGVSGIITDVNINLRIVHSWAADLDVYLISPDGTQVELFTDVGGSSNGFENTTLDDEAGTSIRDGSYPFIGTYRPEGSLSDFDGEDANGTWTLRVIDDAYQDIGILNDWSLNFETTAETDTSSDLLVSGYVPGDEIVDVDVTIDIDHNETQVLTVDLVSPIGTRITLFDSVGGTGDDFDNTVFDDEADVGIGDGTAPFTGSFRPQEALGAFDGESPNGAWRLEITDSFGTGENTLNNWSISFLTTASVGEPDITGGVIGDVNGDGLDDVIVSAPRFLTDGLDNELGFSYIFHGRPGSLDGIPGGPEEADDLISGTNADLGIVDGSLGGTVVELGDLNGDGYDDFGLARAAADVSDPDAALLVFYGAAAYDSVSITPDDADLIVRANPAGSTVKRLTAWSVTSGDLNRDGAADLIIGEPAYEIRNAGGTILDAQQRGSAYIFFSVADHADLDLGDADIVLEGVGEFDQFGVLPAQPAIDLNGDRINDLVIGASAADGTVDGLTLGGGRVYAIYGSASRFELPDDDSFEIIANRSFTGSGDFLVKPRHGTAGHLRGCRCRWRRTPRYRYVHPPSRRGPALVPLHNARRRQCRRRHPADARPRSRTHRSPSARRTAHSFRTAGATTWSLPATHCASAARRTISPSWSSTSVDSSASVMISSNSISSNSFLSSSRASTSTCRIRLTI